MEFTGISRHLDDILRYFDPSLLEHLPLIAGHTVPLDFKAGEKFPKTGYENNQVAFVTKGVFRVYFTDENQREMIIRLPSEGDFTMYLEDYKQLNPQIEYIWEAVTDASILTWNKQNLEYLSAHVPSWNYLTLKITQTLILRLYLERGEMFNDNATQRYVKFAARRPTLIERVPLRYVASYLGIAPQSLSRIRHQIAQKKR